MFSYRSEVCPHQHVQKATLSFLSVFPSTSQPLTQCISSQLCLWVAQNATFTCSIVLLWSSSLPRGLQASPFNAIQHNVGGKTQVLHCHCFQLSIHVPVLHFHLPKGEIGCSFSIWFAAACQSELSWFDLQFRLLAWSWFITLFNWRSTPNNLSTHAPVLFLFTVTSCLFASRDDSHHKRA